MHVKNNVEKDEFTSLIESDGAELLHPLVAGHAARSASSHLLQGVTIGELIAVADDGQAPLVVYPGQQGSAAVGARSVVDLHSAHIGRRVVLVFEAGDPARPIVMGVLREEAGLSVDEKPGTVDVEADGQRLVVSAREQLVLRCGKASITLTKAGKVLVQGTYVSSRSAGMNRLKGGSVQIN